MEVLTDFEKDVIEGFEQKHKQLPSKYFYDDVGSRIYQEIMQLEEYYLPGCELEILQTRTFQIADLMQHSSFDIIELGAGDGSKTVHFLKQLLDKHNDIVYYPVDISLEALNINQSNINGILPALPIYGIAGDYFETLHQLENHSPKMILFMGSNIGNYQDEKALEFLSLVRENMHGDDLLLVGIDLRKNPNIILKAYNDSKGVTKRFNLNLLHRMNRELEANMNVHKFDHYPYYDPVKGITYSYLVSLEKQIVKIADRTFSLKKNELIRTEVSQKYSTSEIEQMGHAAGFGEVVHFLDSRAYFSVSVFKKYTPQYYCGPNAQVDE